MMLEVRGVLKQIYKNIRSLVRNNPVMRSVLNLDTKVAGVYIPDLAMYMIDNLVQYCEMHGYTEKRIFIIVEELNKVEMLIKDSLQYFNYFIRPDFSQKPDIDMATEKYKELADEKTIEELRDLVGTKNKIDFAGLGIKKLEFTEEDADLNYDDVLDEEDAKYDESKDPDNKYSPDLDGEDES